MTVTWGKGEGERGSLSIEKVGKVVEGETSAAEEVEEGREGKLRLRQGASPSARQRVEGGNRGLAAPRLAFQADSVNRVHYFLVISFYNSGLLS